MAPLLLSSPSEVTGLFLSWLPHPWLNIQAGGAKISLCPAWQTPQGSKRGEVCGGAIGHNAWKIPKEVMKNEDSLIDVQA